MEIGLMIGHVEMFLIEMGVGFAFLGMQYHIEVSGDDDFMPEYIGKLNFYCSAVDDILYREGDNRTIGLLLCKTKDRIKTEYAFSIFRSQ